VASIGNRGGAHRVLVGRCERKKALGRPTVRRKNKGGQWIFKKWERDMDWIDMVSERDRWRTVISAAMNTNTSDFMKIRSAAAELFHADGQTDGHDEEKSLFAILRTRLKMGAQWAVLRIFVRLAKSLWQRNRISMYLPYAMKLRQLKSLNEN
jgi:hypothetical protein